MASSLRGSAVSSMAPALNNVPIPTLAPGDRRRCMAPQGKGTFETYAWGLKMSQAIWRSTVRNTAETLLKLSAF